MALQRGDLAPDCEAETTEGRSRFHEWLGTSWAVLFSHPKDFTWSAQRSSATWRSLNLSSTKRNIKIIGLSVDPVDNHKRWSTTSRRRRDTRPRSRQENQTPHRVSHDDRAQLR